MEKRIIILIITALTLCLPLAADVGVNGKLFHEQSVQPGDSYSGLIVLKNQDSKPQDVKLYQTDYLFFSTGESFYGDPGENPRSNADWVHISTKRTTIPAGGSVNLNFRVDVPSETPLIGTYWSVIMIESIPEESPESSEADSSQLKVGLLQVIRYAYQVITNIGDTGSRMLSFTDAQLIPDEGKVILTLDVQSTGERTMRAELSCELYDDKGNFVKRIDSTSHRLHPGTSRKYKVDLSDTPRGTYKALVIVDCGDDYVFGKNINLSF